MQNKRLLLITIALSMPATASLSYPVKELKDNKVVVDKDGRPVTSIISRQCVRTGWETSDGSNPCGDEKLSIFQVEQTEPKVSVAKILKTDERTVHFAFDSDELDGKAKSRLSNLAKVLSESDDVLRADIVGFADRIGSSDYNLELSKKRAKAVMDYMATQGYLSTRIAQTRGLGESRPITNCSSDKVSGKLINCLSPDRRVEVEVRFTDEVAVYQ